mmetsp:Transcript_61906/g.110040  ORF Transcript_61906/g.110040 Transcript_61906/m.110040 type:complete len:320 (+) Transcript_61906:69-1028(+)|eukprot:CAMPEP_0197660096 /NCGR_PEP_ID=MMETSP1338-20131121/50442_1 /TAXON_ID=43686 ORGANISM="Pelagodinium beii, Strain RCC1491" /NCGR_SAMPLE_ID=MMETSP1338 /ASSEMBLY_ACC=CAM_ASM_000754 /LENGTH=319 /DNA_ID=CAMNT_0043237357 /DNA_START=69 /DNA_END=1028 /DNA_ORIENTATION=-
MQFSNFHVILLLSVINVTGALKVLLFWTVDSKPRTQEVVQRNVAYAKQEDQGGFDCCDVFLAHYDGNPKEWDQKWYHDNVVRYSANPGFKFKSFKEFYLDQALQDFNWAQQYEWVWTLDSDIDITHMNLRRFFAVARSSGSVLISPTFQGDAAQWTDFNLRLQGSGFFDQEDHTKQTAGDLQAGEDAATTASKINVIGRPDEHCSYRHTTYVEMTATLIHVSALDVVFRLCEHCIGEKAEWGMDRIWCSVTRKQLSIDKPCAYIDEVPVLHLDWKSAPINGDFPESDHEVREYHAQDYVAIENLDCIPRVARTESAPVV